MELKEPITNKKKRFYGSNWLARYRISKYLTQAEMAQRIGKTRTCYANIETGVRRPSVETAKKIASVLEFDWTKFYEDQDKSE